MSGEFIKKAEKTIGVLKKLPRLCKKFLNVYKKLVKSEEPFNLIETYSKRTLSTIVSDSIIEIFNGIKLNYSKEAINDLREYSAFVRAVARKTWEKDEDKGEAINKLSNQIKSLADELELYKEKIEN